MIQIAQLTKRYRGQTILDGVSLEARPGRVTGFVGPNGAGKSSTLRCLLGLDPADGGIALINGRRYRDLSDPWQHLGAVLDGSGAHPSRTARAHLRWVAAGAGVGRQRVAEVLEEVGLAQAARQRVRTFSLGMSQRLGLAAALLGEPEVLVLDEPINGMDPEGMVWIRSLLRERAAAGGTVLVSSHMLSELSEVADDVVVIAQGSVRAAGTLAEVAAGYANLEEAFFALTSGHGLAAGKAPGLRATDEPSGAARPGATSVKGGR
ncbi:ABC-type transporter ATP-binding protein EcsA [Actinomyces bovis]|uniref:ABC-type transporter ATP-binding protein EcsA n=1 Tax=Actinomyces bovis TaxID=1658 RepID=A0ABY1VNJ2_9ACTO|nr:ATP-binding cassette domain-containing protein [Actinomyces bovis]SPT53673.1 ABC-type transporter ATP-binding protein EcsA [Actinomyces bovis]VEG55776.1 ABC-type transporter ATP-binding protein EcsA [Actinomyces israelii]